MHTHRTWIDAQAHQFASPVSPHDTTVVRDWAASNRPDEQTRRVFIGPHMFSFTSSRALFAISLASASGSTTDRCSLRPHYEIYFGDFHRGPRESWLNFKISRSRNYHGAPGRVFIDGLDSEFSTSSRAFHFSFRGMSIDDYQTMRLFSLIC
jgi:hypothetical protein